MLSGGQLHNGVCMESQWLSEYFSRSYWKFGQNNVAENVVIIQYMPYLASWRHRWCRKIKAVPRQSFVIHPNGSCWWQSRRQADNIGPGCKWQKIVIPCWSFGGPLSPPNGTSWSLSTCIVHALDAKTIRFWTKILWPKTSILHSRNKVFELNGHSAAKNFSFWMQKLIFWTKIIDYGQRPRFCSAETRFLD
jgi:hypothetical protein